MVTGYSRLKENKVEAPWPSEGQERNVHQNVLIWQHFWAVFSKTSLPLTVANHWNTVLYTLSLVQNLQYTHRTHIKGWRCFSNVERVSALTCGSAGTSKYLRHRSNQWTPLPLAWRFSLFVKQT